MKAGETYMEKQHCVEIALKNIIKHNGYKLLAICGNKQDSIVITDCNGNEHRYKFHFVVSNGNEVIDDMHYNKPIDAYDYFNKYVNKDAVFDRRTSELDVDTIQKLCSSVGANKIAQMI